MEWRDWKQWDKSYRPLCRIRRQSGASSGLVIYMRLGGTAQPIELNRTTPITSSAVANISTNDDDEDVFEITVKGIQVGGGELISYTLRYV